MDVNKVLSDEIQRLKIVWRQVYLQNKTEQNMIQHIIHVSASELIDGSNGVNISFFTVSIYLENSEDLYVSNQDLGFHNGYLVLNILLLTFFNVVFVF